MLDNISTQMLRATGSICLATDELKHAVFTRACLIFWTQCSMYAYYVGGPFSYSGLVSAFIAAQTLLNNQCTFVNVGSDSTISFSSLVQTSMGIFIFVLVELLIRPQSAITLLRANMQLTMVHLQ